MSMFGKFRDKLQTLKADLKEKAEQRAPKDLMAPLQVDMEKVEEINSKNRMFGRTRQRSRSASTILDDVAVKTGRGTTIRSEREVMDDLDPSYFDCEFDAKGKALEDMTEAIACDGTMTPQKEPIIPNNNVGENPFAPQVEVGDKGTPGNPFTTSNNSSSSSSKSTDPSLTNNTGNSRVVGNPFLKNSQRSAPSSDSITKEKTDIYLMEQISHHDRTKDIISGRLMTEITLNYNKIVKSMRHVNEIDMDLTRASISVKLALNKLRFAKDTVVRATLTLFSENQKRERMKRLYSAVSLIKKLSSIESHVSCAVDNQEFVRAEMLLRKTSDVLLEYAAMQFTSLDGMRERLQHTRMWLRRQIDKELADAVLKFDGTRYGDILWSYHISDLHSQAIAESKASEALSNLENNQEDYAYISKYRLKGPVESSKGITGMAERVQRIFLNGMEKTLRQSVDLNLSGPVARNLSFSKKMGGNNQNEDNELEYATACAKLTPVNFVSSLKKSLQELTEYLHSHFLCTQWHRDAFSQLNSDAQYLHRPNRFQDEMQWEITGGSRRSPSSSVGSSVAGEENAKGAKNNFGGFDDPPSAFYCNSVARGLVISREVVWDAMQRRISFFVSSVPIVCPTFKLEHVVEVYALLQKMELVGKDFLNLKNKESEVESPVCACSKDFLNRYIKALEFHIFGTLDNFLARERWEGLHVSLEDLGGMESLVLRHNSTKKEVHAEQTKQISPIRENIFESFLQDSSPLLNLPLPEKKCAPGSISESEKSEELVVTNEALNSVPLVNKERVLTSTSVNGFAKFAGICLQVMENLPSVAYRAFKSAFATLNYYMHAVINLFLPSNILVEMMRSNLPNDDMNGVAWRFANLRKTIQLMAKQLRDVLPPQDSSGKMPASSSRVERSASLNNEIEVDENSLYGLEKCCSASESLFFLMEVLEYLRPRFIACLGREFESECNDLYVSNRLAIEELRVLMYDVATRRVLPRDIVLSMIEGLKWDKKDLPETYYPYVTKLLEKVGMASGQMQSLVPKHLHKSVWLSVVDVLMEHLLEALSRVKKCNSNGRAQMALDLATLYRGLEQISQETSESKRRHILGSFIKAYYFDTASDFVSWMETGLAKGGEFYSDNILSRRHFLSLITLEKSPLAKLPRKKRNELKTTVETVWMKAIIERQQSEQ